METLSPTKTLGRLKDYYKPIVLELYLAHQSEGSRAGLPTVVVRTSGCTHRCYFGEGGWCDSWYTSVHPERPTYSFNDIVKIYDENPHVKEMMLTGGSPSMHGALVNELTHFCFGRGIVLTLETEGSHFLETDYPIDLISLSPKFSNSIPKLGVTTPLGTVVDEKFIKRHNKYRLNKEVIKNMLKYHLSYHYKPVWVPGDEKSFKEIEDFRVEMDIPKNQTWLMPGGSTREELIPHYAGTIKKALEVGYNFCPRAHIIAFDEDRLV